MTFTIDTSLSWTDHFAEYGFAVLKGLVGREFCQEALAEVRRVVDDDRPLNEWTLEKPGLKYTVFYPGQNPVLEKLYDQPGLREALNELFGGKMTELIRHYYTLWLNPCNPDAKPRLKPLGHIDSGDLYRGLSFQISLVDTEPFSGNMTVFPGTHKLVQKAVIDNPELATAGGAFIGVKRPYEPYEFIAEVGDVLLVHHMAFHSGNPSHSANRVPRVALRAEAFRPASIKVIDPSDPNLSPWERSCASNGYCELKGDPVLEMSAPGM
jgi:hypothetical protein